PAYRVVAHVGVVPIGVIGHLLYHDRVLDADLLEGRIPGEKALTHRITVLYGNSVIDPEDDWLLRRRQLRRRVRLFQVPSVDVANGRIVLRVVVEALEIRLEVPDSSVERARLEAVIDEREDRIAHAKRQAPWICLARLVCSSAAAREVILCLD